MSTIDTVSSALPPASSTTTATALTADAPAVIVPAAEGPTEEEAAASRKRKLDGEQLEKKRSRRMFGLLQGTLNQAKEQTKKLSGVSQQRQELEERLARKLGEEKAAMEVQTLKLRQQRELQSEISAKETEMYTLDSMVCCCFFITSNSSGCSDVFFFLTASLATCCSTKHDMQPS